VALIFEVVGFALFLFWLLLIARIVVEFTGPSVGTGTPGVSPS